MAGIKGQRATSHNTVSPKEHILRGTFRPDRHADHVIQEAPEGTPEQPEPLEGCALREFERMKHRLELCRTLSLIDDAAIYQYAKLWGETEANSERQVEAALSIKRLEENLRDLKGAELVACFQEISKLLQLEFRYINAIRQGRMAIRQYLVEFGMTPASRNRVKLPPKKDQVDPNKERYFGAARPA